MILCDYHIHTDFSDGADSMRAVAEAAYAQGMEAIGFSDHGYAAYDPDSCMRWERIAEYVEACRRLREEYAGRMRVYCGIEQDMYSDGPTDCYDYVIGSLHYLYLSGEYLCVDWKPEPLERACALLGGDMLAVAEAYFDQLAQVVERTRCQLIGHFDLICKLNRDGRYFDEDSPRYIAAWRKAADALLKAGVPFEINTGAMARGYRTEPYPALPILRYLHEHGAQFVLSSDSHRRQTLRYDFERQEQRCVREGIPLLKQLDWRKRA